MVILRKPISILCSHVQFQYLGVNNLEDDLIQHSSFVYNDQAKYLDNWFTLRSCLEANQDSYIEVLIKAMQHNRPIYIIDCDDYIATSRTVTSLILATINLSPLLDAEFELIISKLNFLEAQENVLDYYINKQGGSWTNRLGDGILDLTNWSYNNGFRVVNNDILSKYLTELLPLVRADYFYSIIKSSIPKEGLLLNSQRDKHIYAEKIYDAISMTMEN